MQLLLLLLLALTGGNANTLKEVEPVLESLGGNEALEALKKAEELSGMLSAVQAMTGGLNATRANSFNGSGGGKGEEFSGAGFGRGASFGGGNEGQTAQGFPLAPIANIADENITYCLSRFVATGE